MKKTLSFFCLISLFVACSDNASNTNNANGKVESKENLENATETAGTKAEDPEVTRGLELIAKSDCLTCHKVSETAVGPAYEAVAAKYPATDQTYESLASKIISGGAGNWGEIPMPAHTSLSKEDAKAMARYVMSLKK